MKRVSRTQMTKSAFFCYRSHIRTFGRLNIFRIFHVFAWIIQIYLWTMMGESRCCRTVSRPLIKRQKKKRNTHWLIKKCFSTKMTISFLSLWQFFRYTACNHCCANFWVCLCRHLCVKTKYTPILYKYSCMKWDDAILSPGQFDWLRETVGNVFIAMAIKRKSQF